MRAVLWLCAGSSSRSRWCECSLPPSAANAVDLAVTSALAEAGFMNGAWITLDGGQRKAIMDV